MNKSSYMKWFVLLFVLLYQITTAQAQDKASRHTGDPSASIQPGAERIEIYLPLLRGKSVGVFANQTSLIGHAHLVDSLLKRGIVIHKIFSPEHGFRGDADAGESVSSSKDPSTGIPILSLYGSRTKPSAADLAGIDVLVFDIQDVGVRFYTYISSFQRFLEAAAENNLPIILLDRPNPNGYYVDGPVLDRSYASFVGLQQVPVVYGMTLGEYGRMLLGEKLLDPAIATKVNSTHALAEAAGCMDSLINPKTRGQAKPSMKDFQFFVVPCANYTHASRYTLPVKPSPNLPNMQSVYLYPSLCFFEGTIVSLGRGTDKPFQQFGHPSFPSNLYSFTPRSTPGARNPPLLNQNCFGFDLSTIDLHEEVDNRLQLKWLLQAYALFPHKEEFFLSNHYFDKLAGNGELMQQIKEGKSETEIRKSWEPGLSRFKTIRKKYLIYPEGSSLGS